MLNDFNKREIGETSKLNRVVILEGVDAWIKAVNVVEPWESTHDGAGDGLFQPPSLKLALNECFS